MNLIVYVHTCRQNHKQYVGVTRGTLEARWASAVKQSEKRSYNRRKFKEPNSLRKAIEFYGAGEWDHEVLETHDNIIDALFAEIRLIAKLKTNEFGYNRSKGGEIPPGIRLEEIIEGLQRYPHLFIKKRRISA